MKIATYGPKVFSVSDKIVNTFGAVSRSSSYKVDEQDNGSNKPKVKAKAPGLEDMSFGIELKSEYVNVRKEIESWFALQGKSYYFIVGKEKYGQHKWALIGVDVSDQEFSAKGLLRSAHVNLSFKEMAKATKSTVTAKSTRNTKKKAR